MRYNSFMKNIDNIFTQLRSDMVIPGHQSARDEIQRWRPYY